MDLPLDAPGAACGDPCAPLLCFDAEFSDAGFSAFFGGCFFFFDVALGDHSLLSLRFGAGHLAHFGGRLLPRALDIDL